MQSRIAMQAVVSFLALCASSGGAAEESAAACVDAGASGICDSLSESDCAELRGTGTCDKSCRFCGCQDQSSTCANMTQNDCQSLGTGACDQTCGFCPCDTIPDKELKQNGEIVKLWCRDYKKVCDTVWSKEIHSGICDTTCGICAATRVTTTTTTITPTTTTTMTTTTATTLTTTTTTSADATTTTTTTTSITTTTTTATTSTTTTQVHSTATTISTTTTTATATTTSTCAEEPESVRGDQWCQAIFALDASLCEDLFCPECDHSGECDKVCGFCPMGAENADTSAQAVGQRLSGGLSMDVDSPAAWFVEQPCSTEAVRQTLTMLTGTQTEDILIDCEAKPEGQTESADVECHYTLDLSSTGSQVFPATLPAALLGELRFAAWTALLNGEKTGKCINTTINVVANSHPILWEASTPAVDAEGDAGVASGFWIFIAVSIIILSLVLLVGLLYSVRAGKSRPLAESAAREPDAPGLEKGVSKDNLLASRADASPPGTLSIEAINLRGNIHYDHESGVVVVHRGPDFASGRKNRGQAAFDHEGQAETTIQDIADVMSILGRDAQLELYYTPEEEDGAGAQADLIVEQLVLRGVGRSKLRKNVTSSAVRGVFLRFFGGRPSQDLEVDAACTTFTCGSALAAGISASTVPSMKQPTGAKLLDVPEVGVNATERRTRGWRPASRWATWAADPAVEAFQVIQPERLRRPPNSRPAHQQRETAPPCSLPRPGGTARSRVTAARQLGAATGSSRTPRSRRSAASAASAVGGGDIGAAAVDAPSAQTPRAAASGPEVFNIATLQPTATLVTSSRQAAHERSLLQDAGTSKTAVSVGAAEAAPVSNCARTTSRLSQDLWRHVEKRGNVFYDAEDNRVVVQKGLAFEWFCDGTDIGVALKDPKSDLKTFEDLVQALRTHGHEADVVFHGSSRETWDARSLSAEEFAHACAQLICCRLAREMPEASLLPKGLVMDEEGTDPWIELLFWEDDEEVESIDVDE